MKINRIIIALAIVFSAAAAFAQKQLTGINEENGESVEVTIPDDPNIYEYNEEWLDSIPYLMEHVRNCEPWAYENLARCYRFGIGMEKCMTNAMIYYDKAGINERKLAENAYESDPTDELGFMNHLMDDLDRKRLTIDEAIALLDSAHAPIPSWAICMKRIFDNRNVEDLESFIESSIDLNTITGDELVASIACLRILRPNTPPIRLAPASPEFMRKLTLAAKKIPMLYKIAGDKYWALYKDCPNDEQAMKKAFEMYHYAYLHGLLDAGGAVEVLDFRDNNPLYEGFPFTRDELAHLDGFYSKEYRIHFKSPCTVEECIVEEVTDEDSPVVLESEAYQ